MIPQLGRTIKSNCRDGSADSIVQMPSDEQIRDIEDLAAQLAADLDEIEQDFESRRRLIEMLNVQATLKVEDGHKVIYAECILDEKNLPINCKKAYVDVN